MKNAFLLSGGQCTDPRLQVVISDSLGKSTAEKIVTELKDIIASDQERAHERLERILHTTCVQDLLERGEFCLFLVSCAV